MTNALLMFIIGFIVGNIIGYTVGVISMWIITYEIVKKLLANKKGGKGR